MDCTAALAGCIPETFRHWKHPNKVHGARYYYILNQQGGVIRMVDINGATATEYQYISNVVCHKIKSI